MTSFGQIRNRSGLIAQWTLAVFASGWLLAAAEPCLAMADGSHGHDCPACPSERITGSAHDCASHGAQQCVQGLRFDYDGRTPKVEMDRPASNPVWMPAQDWTAINPVQRRAALQANASTAPLLLTGPRLHLKLCVLLD